MNKQLINSISKAISNSKKIVRTITSWKRYSRGLIIYQDSMRKALSNGVQFQVLVTEKTEDIELSKEAKVFNDHPNSLVKFVSSQSKVIEIIIDDQEAFVITEPKANLAESSALWTNNKSLIMALTTCFNTFCDLSEV
jgi:deoxycytidine triphosphate deaminase